MEGREYCNDSAEDFGKITRGRSLSPAPSLRRRILSVDHYDDEDCPEEDSGEPCLPFPETPK